MVPHAEGSRKKDAHVAARIRRRGELVPVHETTRGGRVRCDLVRWTPLLGERGEGEGGEGVLGGPILDEESAWVRQRHEKQRNGYGSGKPIVVILPTMIWRPQRAVPVIVTDWRKSVSKAQKEGGRHGPKGLDVMKCIKFLLPLLLAGAGAYVGVWVRFHKVKVDVDEVTNIVLGIRESMNAQTDSMSATSDSLLDTQRNLNEKLDTLNARLSKLLKARQDHEGH